MRGSLRRRGATWTYVIYLGRDADGKKKHKWVGGFATKRACEAALNEALQRRATGTWGDPGKRTVADFLAQWLESVRPSLRDTTAASYEATLTGWIIPRIGHQRLAALDAARISALLGELSTSGRRDGKGGLSARSVRYAHAIMSHAFGDATKWGLLPRNPVALVDPPWQEHREMRAWSASEAQAFLAHVADDRLFALWALLIATGMRRGEACGLRWEDVDRGTVTIRRARVVTGYSVHTSEPKTARGRRVIALDPVTAAILQAWRKAQIAERLRAGDAWMDSGYVFTTELGAPLHPQSVTVTFKRLTKAAGLRVIPLHGLRHTSATLAFAAGVHGKATSARLGHATAAFTMDTYTDAVDGVEVDAAARVAALIYPQAQ